MGLPISSFSNYLGIYKTSLADLHQTHCENDGRPQPNFARFHYALNIEEDRCESDRHHRLFFNITVLTTAQKEVAFLPLSLQKRGQ